MATRFVHATSTTLAVTGPVRVKSITVTAGLLGDGHATIRDSTDGTGDILVSLKAAQAHSNTWVASSHQGVKFFRGVHVTFELTGGEATIEVSS